LTFLVTVIILEGTISVVEPPAVMTVTSTCTCSLTQATDIVTAQCFPH
jgi:hypothetical protein